MDLLVIICYSKPDDTKVTIDKVESPEGAGIIVDEVYTRGFDHGDFTVTPDMIQWVWVRPSD